MFEHHVLRFDIDLLPSGVLISHYLLGDFQTLGSAFSCLDRHIDLPLFIIIELPSIFHSVVIEPLAMINPILDFAKVVVLIITIEEYAPTSKCIVPELSLIETILHREVIPTPSLSLTLIPPTIIHIAIWVQLNTHPMP